MGFDLANPSGVVDEPLPGLPKVVARHPWLTVGLIGVGVAAGFAYLRITTPLYTAVAKLYVQPNRPRVIADTEARVSADANPNFLNTERAVLVSTPVLAMAVDGPGIRDAVPRKDGDDVVVTLRKKLRVDVGKKDDTIGIEFDAPDRRQAIAVVAAVTDAYISYSVQQAQRKGEDLLRILHREKTECEKQLKARAQAMLALKQAAGTMSFDNRDSAGMMAIGNLSESLKVAGAEAVAAESGYTEAAAACRNDAAVQKRIAELEKTGNILITSETEINLLRWTIADLQLKVDELVRTYGYMPDHKQVQAARSRLDELRGTYVLATKRRWELARAREEKLRASLKAQQALAEDYTAKAADYAKLDVEAKRLERQADLLDGRIQEIMASQQAGAMNITVVEPARADIKPTKPDKTSILAMSLLAGLGMGCGAACLRERLAPRFHSLQEVRAALALPILGLVPRFRNGRMRRARPLLAHRQNTPGLADACRTIRTALAFAIPEGGACRKLMVTSPASGDGGSTVAANLGVAMAQSGRRVLIVDGDFDHPVLHDLFETGSGEGLMSVLMGQERPASAIKRTAIEGLDILPLGPLSGQLADAINEQTLSRVLGELAAGYDVLLLNAPAVSSASQTRLMACLCDGVLMVVRLGRTDARLAREACDGLRDVGAGLLGVVINAVGASAGKGAGFFDVTGELKRTEQSPAVRAVLGERVASEANKRA